MKPNELKKIDEFILKIRFPRIKKKIQKIKTNYNWERRYKNLSKKYEEVLEENERLRKLIEKDKNLKEIENLKSYVTTLQRKIDFLRVEAKR